MNTEKCNGLGMGIDQANGKKDQTYFQEINDLLSIKKCVSHNFKHIRKQKGLTQQKFADLLGVNRAAYAAYEEQRADPPLNVVIVVSNLTGIDINTLLTDELMEDVNND